MKRRSPEERYQDMLQKFKEGQSRHGKAKEKEKYQKRKKLLAEIKRKRGCAVCGENDPRALQFCPPKDQKIKFAPLLQNATRSLKDWQEVIRRCGVLCLNCLAKKKAPRKSGRTRKVEIVREVPEMPQESAVNASLSGDLHVSRPNHGRSCGCCKRPLAKARQKFCSSRCRLLFWAAKKILEAYCAGQADGLREVVAKLVKKGGG